MYTTINNSLKITIVPLYQNNLSSPKEHKYVWEYNVHVENNSEIPIQLVRKEWQIIDSNGNTQSFGGSELINQQPIILPGESFDYTSHAKLKTPSGIIKGSYKIIAGEKEFEMEVPTFSLDNPEERYKIH
jgi:ApaG protein